MCIHIYIHICTCTSKYMCVYIYTHIFAISLKLSGFPTKTRNVAGECELFRMGPRERVQTLTQRTWGRRQASCRCVRRGRCRWVIRKMRVLETERTRLRHLRVATWVQLLWSQQHLLKDFVGVCGSRKMVRLNQRVGGASTKELFQRVVSWDRRSWGQYSWDRRSSWTKYRFYQYMDPIDPAMRSQGVHFPSLNKVGRSCELCSNDSQFRILTWAPARGTCCACTCVQASSPLVFLSGPPCAPWHCVRCGLVTHSPTCDSMVGSNGVEVFFFPGLNAVPDFHWRFTLNEHV